MSARVRVPLTRRDIGPWANFAMALHETHVDQLVLILGKGTDKFGEVDLNFLKHERFRGALIKAGQDELPPCDLSQFVLSLQQLGSIRLKAVLGGADPELLPYFPKDVLDKFAKLEHP